MKSIFIITMVAVAVLTTNEVNYRHQKLKDTGIYFEEISKVVFHKQHLDIITTIELPNSEAILESLFKCNRKLKEICEELGDTSTMYTCKAFRAELKWHIEEIDRQNKKLTEMYGRQKRGLVDIGGKISKFLIGTLDSEDAEKIYNNLQELNTNQAKLFEFENKQVAIIKSNFETLVKPITELQNETMMIEEKLNEIIERSNNQQDKNMQAQVKQHQLQEITSILLIKCLHIDRMQDEASEIIATIEDKRLHPLVISFASMMKIINNSTADFNQDFLNHEILRQIVQVNHIEVKGKIIVKLTIPIIEKEFFTIYKAYITPFERKGFTQIYEIEAEYIATNNDKTRFMELKIQNMDKCTKLYTHQETKIMTCSKEQPVITEAYKHCITALLSSPYADTQNCRTIKTKTTNTITKLSNQNSWMYSVTEPTKFIIKCKQTTDTLDAINEGIITFFTKCTLSTKDFTVQIEGNLETVEITQPEITQNMDEIDSSEETQITGKERLNANTKLAKLRINDHREHNKNFIMETHKINNLEETLKAITQYKQNSETTMKITVSTAATIIIIIIITILLYWKLKNRSKKNHPNITTNIELTTKAAEQNIPAPNKVEAEEKHQRPYTSQYGLEII